MVTPRCRHTKTSTGLGHAEVSQYGDRLETDLLLSTESPADRTPQPESTRTKLEQRIQFSYSHMISLCFLDSPWLPGCGLRQCVIGLGACGLAGYSRQAGPYISIVSKIRMNFRCLSVTSTISLLVNALLQHQRAGNWGAP